MPLMLNDVKIAGNLTRDPELRKVGDTCVVNFGLAINRKYKNAGGELKEDTTFIDVEAWSRQAELCHQYLSKGKNALVEGSLKLDQWEKDGVKRSKISVNARRIHFLSPLEDRPAHESGPSAPSEPIDDEPPF